MDTGTDEFICEHCGMTNLVEFQDYPQKDKGTVTCAICNEVLLRWKGTRDYGFARPKIPTPDELEAQEALVASLERGSGTSDEIQRALNKLLIMLNVVNKAASKV